MRTIGALIFPGFELLDVFGPMQMFGLLPDKYELHLIAEKRGAVQSDQQLSAHAEFTLLERSDYDILFVPGGVGTRREAENADLLTWLQKVSANAEFVLGVCTGSLLLAAAGLLDGKRATTNKSLYDMVTSRAPDVNWQPQARWVEDGRIFTSSGVTAGMDMTLAVISRMHGRARAQEVAEMCEYEWHNDADHDPFAATYGLA